MTPREVQARHSRLNYREKLALAGVLALVLLTFASTFTFGWVYDDPPQISANPDLRWNRIGFLFTHDLWASATGFATARFYRPLLAFWFLLNKTAFGLNPHWFHLTSVLAHLLATALAFLIAFQLLKTFAGALFAAALFGVHPLQVESVSWISAVNDPLAASLCFASFLACRKARASTQNPALWWFLSALFFACALLTKEVSVVLPAIVLIDFWYASDEVPSQRLKNLAGAITLALYGAVAACWLLLRHRFLGHVAATTTTLSWASALLTAPKILLFQLLHAVAPMHLSPHYDFPPLTPAALPQAVLAFCGVLILAAVAYLFARRSPSLSVALAWLVLPLFPSLNPRWLNEDDFVHDRYMYLSMLGVALLAGAAFGALKRRWPERRMIPGLALALVVGLAFSSVIQSQFWSNDVALFARGVQIAPHNEWAQLNYGSALSSRARFSEASEHFVRSYELKPGWRAAQYSAFAFRKSAQFAQAEQWYSLAVHLHPSSADTWFGFGQLRLDQDRPEEALVFFRKALSLRPEAEGFHAAVGIALERLGQHDAALDEYRAELRLHPNQPDALNGIARSRQEM